MSASAGNPTENENGPSPDLDYLDDYEGRPQLDEPGPIDWISPILMSLVAVAALIPSLELGIGTFSQPGPGLWPFLNAVLILGLVPVVLIARHRFDPPKRVEVMRVLGIAIPMLAFAPLYSVAGLIGAGIPVLFVVARFVGTLGWFPAAAVSVIAPTVVYLGFAELLGVNLRAF